MDGVALAEQVLHGEVARPLVLAEAPTKAKTRASPQDVGDGVVAIAV